MSQTTLKETREIHISVCIDAQEARELYSYLHKCFSRLEHWESEPPVCLHLRQLLERFTEE